MRTLWQTIVFLMGLSVGARAAAARPAACAPSRLVVVLDRSSSMNGATGAVSKWSAARAAIDQVAAAYGGAIELGLATFPYPDECGPGRLDVPPALDRRDALAAALAAPPPAAGAWTPLGETLLALADDPAVTGGDAVVHVAVITDGFQWCSPFDPDARHLPVTGAEALRDAGAVTFVVGFGGGVDVATLDQMAVVAGTARAGCDPAGASPGAPHCYYQADDAGALLAALMDIAAVAAEETCDGLDNDCDGEIDEGACPVPGADAGPDADAAAADDIAGVPGGCGCGAGGQASGAIAGAILFGIGLALVLRTRRRATPRRRRRPPGS